MDMSTLEEDFGIDVAGLLARYRAERDRRLRPDGVSQFVRARGQFAHYGDDPWVNPGFTRAPLADEVDVLVIGGGLGAIMLGAQLRKAGVESIRYVERAGDFGGVWYWNRYPGAACDTQAILYLPMLEEMGTMPRRKYAPQPEILAHFQNIARRFELYRDNCFQTSVTAVTWDEADARWLVETDRNDRIRARFVVIPSGPMDFPKLPGIPGIENFKGHAFHTSRWDYAYTGGDATGGLAGLADKRVAIIGTGATAIQCVPHLAQGAKHLTVFQRTPSSVDFRNDEELDADWVASLAPGWQQKLLENFTALVGGTFLDEDLVGDGWTSVITNIKQLLARMAQRGEDAPPHPMMLAQLADYMKMNEVRDRIASVVTDPATAAALQPWYNRFCKRPCFTDNYLPAFNRANVTLVDTAGKGVERITETAIVTGGVEYPIDCLIYSTGFETGAPFAQRLGYPIIGANGVRLEDKWAKGALTQHGIGTNGFPNLFIMSVVQSGLSLNFAHMIAEQAQHMAYVLGRATREGLTRLEVTEAAEQLWADKIDRTAIDQEAFQRECTPSYFNGEGDLTRLNRRNSAYGGGALTFYQILANWRASGTMPGIRVMRGGDLVMDGQLHAPLPQAPAHASENEHSSCTRAAIERFVAVYNEPDSHVYPLYGDEVEWVEMPSGRSGGRAELFTALQEARSFLKGMQLEVLSITATGKDGVLESRWRARTPYGQPMSAHITWEFTVENGLIVKEHDHSVVDR